MLVTVSCQLHFRDGKWLLFSGGELVIGGFTGFASGFLMGGVGGLIAGGAIGAMAEAWTAFVSTATQEMDYLLTAYLLAAFCGLMLDAALHDYEEILTSAIPSLTCKVKASANCTDG